MPTLIVTNGWSHTIQGLGRNHPFPSLSEKRVTKATREALRWKYGFGQVRVSCAAEFESGVWRGCCWIGGQEHGYVIKP